MTDTTSAVAKTLYSDDGQWAFRMSSDSWVIAATYLATCQTLAVDASLSRVRKMAASGRLLGTLRAVIDNAR